VRVIFAGTPAFARVALERLHASGHTVALVLTQPDRSAGRGQQLQVSEVKQFALNHAIALAQPRSLKLDGKAPDDATAARKAIAQANADVMVVAAYGLILPQWVLDDMAPTHAASSGAPRKHGCLNIHASLLPRWRGAAPIHRAIEAGDSHTGVTIMQMDAGLDTGAMLLVQQLPIAEHDTTASLHDHLAEQGAALIVQALDLAGAGRLEPRAQPPEGVTYAHKVEKLEAAIDWSASAQTICRRVRAFNPFPGASATLGGSVIKVWAAQERLLTESSAPLNPGTILAATPAGIAVAAMHSIVVLTELQRPGGKRLTAADFLRGFDLEPGMRFDRRPSQENSSGRLVTPTPS
jgi:methionyl-tRNA formyltransferase